jgi:hypothetical protein
LNIVFVLVVVVVIVAREETVGRKPPFREYVSAEAEVSTLLVAVTRQRLVETHQAGKGLAGAMVICELWRLAVAL